MRTHSVFFGAALSLAAFVAACSDGSEQLPNATGGTASTGTSGSDPGPVAGSAAGTTPLPSGGSGTAPAGGSGSNPTAGTGAGPTAGTGGSDSGGGNAPTGGTASGGTTAGGASMGGGGGTGSVTPTGPFKVLIISTALEFPHDSIPECQKMVTDLGTTDANNSWTTKVEGDDLADFTAAGLKDYALIFSCNPTGRVFSGNSKLADKAGAMKAFQDFIETDGKAFAGVHSASDFEKTNGFPWFTNTLMGAYFDTHDNDGTSGSVVADTQNTAHPVLTGLAGNYSTKDEWYKMNRDPGSQPGFKVLQRLASDSRPLTWVKDVGAGRMFYTVRGHAKSVYAEAPFRSVVMNGILWSTKRL